MFIRNAMIIKPQYSAPNNVKSIVKSKLLNDINNILNIVISLSVKLLVGVEYAGHGKPIILKNL